MFSPLLALNVSLYPFLISVNLLSVAFTAVDYINSGNLTTISISLLSLLVVSMVWWSDLRKEAHLGFHTSKLEGCMRSGMLLFILSEVFFFVAFFWAFYDAAIAPTVELGLVWPPKGIVPLSAYSVPLLNTLILLTSGVTVTWAHHGLLMNSFNKSFQGLSLTVMLGVVFLALQKMEYSEAMFALSDGVFGSTFFISTGFHGMHVFIGMLMLLSALINLSRGDLTFNHHFAFEAGAWYWHFVDVVWLGLYLSVYFWAGL